MSTIAEMIDAWTAAGGKHVHFHQGSEVLPQIPANAALDHRVHGGVCFAASTCFIKLRQDNRKPADIAGSLKHPAYAEVVAERQSRYFQAKDWDEKYTVKGMQHERRFDSGNRARPAELNSRAKLIEQLGTPGLYIFEAYSNITVEGHSVAFDTRKQDNVYFFDANSGIYWKRSLADFGRWYTDYWESKHGDDPDYKSKFKNGSRRLIKYTFM